MRVNAAGDLAQHRRPARAVSALQSSPAQPKPFHSAAEGEDLLARHEVARVALRVVEQLAELGGAAVAPSSAVSDARRRPGARGSCASGDGCAAIFAYITGCVNVGSSSSLWPCLR